MLKIIQKMNDIEGPYYFYDNVNPAYRFSSGDEFNYISIIN